MIFLGHKFLISNSSLLSILASCNLFNNLLPTLHISFWIYRQAMYNVQFLYKNHWSIGLVNWLNKRLAYSILLFLGLSLFSPPPPNNLIGINLQMQLVAGGYRKEWEEESGVDWCQQSELRGELWTCYLMILIGCLQWCTCTVIRTTLCYPGFVRKFLTCGFIHCTCIGNTPLCSSVSSEWDCDSATWSPFFCHWISPITHKYSFAIDFIQ